jgi:hypothetical protein
VASSGQKVVEVRRVGWRSRKVSAPGIQK